MNKKASHIKSIFIFLLAAAVLVMGSIFVTQTVTSEFQNTPKYVFLFIGDGCSYPQINLTKYYLDAMGTESKLSFDEFDVSASSYTYCEDSQVTDSAAAGSAIASGNKVPFGYLNLNRDETIKYETIAEKLKKQKDYKIGIVTSQYLNHATPAAFYSHQNSRYNFYDIGLELAKSDFDFLAGGDFLYKTGADGTNEYLYDIFEQNGYNVTNDPKDVDKNKKNILINPTLASDRTIPFYIDNTESDTMTITELTKLAIDTLYNKTGFFIMVEGGKIDTASHANDARTTIDEVVNFNEAINVALDFYQKNKKDTLILITADHETGGLTLGYTGLYYSVDLKYLSYQTISYYEFAKKADSYRTQNKSFKDAIQDIETCFGLYTNNSEYAVPNPEADRPYALELTEDELERIRTAYNLTMTYPAERIKDLKYNLLYGQYDPLTTETIRILNQKCGISWSTFYHTALNTPVLAKGTKSALFNEVQDNTDMFKILSETFKLK